MGSKPWGQFDFVTLWKSLLPEGYTEPIETESEGAGFDVPLLQAAIFARVEGAANTSQQAYFLKPHSIQTGPEASSARRATGSVEVTRAAPTYGVLTLTAGTILEARVTSSLGEDTLIARLLVAADTTLPESTAPVTVPVEAQFPGYEGNVRAGAVTSFATVGALQVPAVVATTESLSQVVVPGQSSDTFDTSLVGRYLVVEPRTGGPLATLPGPRQIVSVLSGVATFSPALDASDVGRSVTARLVEFADLGLSVTNAEPITGGVADGLGARGIDAGVERAPGETDAEFCDRLQELPDIISPAAVERIATRVLAGSGIRFRILETGDPLELGGFVWDVSPFDVGQVPPLASWTPVLGTQGAVLLSEARSVRHFVIVVDIPPQDAWGLTFDVTSGPVTQPNAWDTDEETSALDGAEFTTALDRIAALYDEVNAARAAGVSFEIIQGALP